MTTLQNPIVVGIFQDEVKAKSAVDTLRNAGFRYDQVGVAISEFTEPTPNLQSEMEIWAYHRNRPVTTMMNTKRGISSYPYVLMVVRAKRKPSSIKTVLTTLNKRSKKITTIQTNRHNQSSHTTHSLCKMGHFSMLHFASK